MGKKSKKADKPKVGKSKVNKSKASKTKIKAGDRKASKIKSGNSEHAQLTAVELSRTFIGADYVEEHRAMRKFVKGLDRLPIMLVPISDGFTGEDFAMALARTYLRMSLMLDSWAERGCPLDEAAMMRMVRADMRAIAEMSISTFSEMLKLGINLSEKQQ